MNRRGVILLLAAAPVASLAQQHRKVWRIGFFYYGSQQSSAETGRYEAFIQGMRELGYVEGRNFVIEARFAGGRIESMPAVAAELVRSKVDVIVATGTPVYRVLQQANVTIPVVMTVTANPVGDGFAASLARPGGNFTGDSAAMADLSAKHVELLKAVRPKLSRIAVLSHPGNQGHPPQVTNVQAAAAGAGVAVLVVPAATEGEIERGFAAMAADGAQAAIVLPDTFYVQQARQITQLAIKHRIAAIFGAREYAEVGGLMSYGPDFRDSFRRAARYVDGILKGAKPAELPIEQPSRVELTINLRTAKALGITIPPAVLVRADRVIE